MILLAAALAQEIEQYNSELDRFHTITETGSLSTEESTLSPMLFGAISGELWHGEVGSISERGVWFPNNPAQVGECGKDRVYIVRCDDIPLEQHAQKFLVGKSHTSIVRHGNYPPVFTIRLFEDRQIT